MTTTGGEFLYANGLHLEETTRSSAHVLVGHRAVHTVMPLAPKQVQARLLGVYLYLPAHATAAYQEAMF